MHVELEFFQNNLLQDDKRVLVHVLSLVYWDQVYHSIEAWKHRLL